MDASIFHDPLGGENIEQIFGGGEGAELVGLLGLEFVGQEAEREEGAERER